MPAGYTQANRPIQLFTPLGPDVLLAIGLHGREGLSAPYRFTLDALTVVNTPVPFDKLVGAPISILLELPKKKERFFHGICAQFSQAESDADFTAYQLEMVPSLWLLTKGAKCRWFQRKTVRDILGKVFDEYGLKVDWRLTGKYEPRDYVCQYRETDFQFVSRIMEEEGIFYYFVHTQKDHTMVVGDHKDAHDKVPGDERIYFQTPAHDLVMEEDHVHELAKDQVQSSGKFTLWDQHFVLPHDHLDVDKKPPDGAKIGEVGHKILTGPSGKLEMYDWPGEYAQRFDLDVGKIPPDGRRTVDLRAQAEASAALVVRGSGNARNFTAGHIVTLDTRPDDKPTRPFKADGKYLITGVSHNVRYSGGYRSAPGGGGFGYTNTFTAHPPDIVFRPARTTPKPVVPGPISAVVVGRPGEEISTDKYGRVKVQFHWDRDGKYDLDSSCWIRMVGPWAGVNWGGMWIPRVGHEVMVAFENGDPDCPVIMGTVWNEHQLPVYKLPDHQTKSYLRSNTSPGGDGYNEIRFEDKAGKEQIYVHAQRQMDERVHEDRLEFVGRDQHNRIGFFQPNEHKGNLAEEKKGSRYEEIAKDSHAKIHRHVEEHFGGNYKLLVGGIDGPGNTDVHIKGYSKETVDKTVDLNVKQQITVSAGKGYDLTAKTNIQEKAGQTVYIEAGMQVHIKAGASVVLEAPSISLSSPGGFVTVSPAGVMISGVMVLINSGGAALPGTGMPPQPAADAADAAPKKPTEADFAVTGSVSNTPPSIPK